MSAIRKRKLKLFVGKRQFYRRVAKDITQNSMHATFSPQLKDIVDVELSSASINTSSKNNVHFNNNNETSEVLNNNLLHLNNLLLNDNSTQNYNFNDSAVDIIDSTCSITKCVLERQLHPNEKNDSIIDRLRTWAALNPHVPQYSLTSLLHLLNHFFPTLPVDARTLLKTSKQFHVQDLQTGQFIYLGIKNSIIQNISQVSGLNTIELQFNIDGLPLFKSCNKQLWPILALVHNSKIKKPFAIGIFCGTSKPQPLSMFLNDFVNELSFLLKNGFEYLGTRYNVMVHSFVCDAPARAYIKCIKSHQGYSCCEKCTEPGEYVNGRVILRNTHMPLRTDESFYSQIDENHHTGISPLLRLNIGLVSLFPIDYMHNVCLGVTRKLLKCWISGNYKVRLSSYSLKRLSEKMISLKNNVPREINRKPRSLDELAHFKATEFRTFLLYLGPAVLKGIVDHSIYEHFTLLHSAIVILCSENYIATLGCQVPSMLLKTFVQHSEYLYNSEFLIYNVHYLIHLSEDVLRYGKLDSFAAFPFENF